MEGEGRTVQHGVRTTDVMGTWYCFAQKSGKDCMGDSVEGKWDVLPGKRSLA